MGEIYANIRETDICPWASTPKPATSSAGSISPASSRPLTAPLISTSARRRSPDAQGDRLFVTGKKVALLFEIKLDKEALGARQCDNSMPSSAESWWACGGGLSSPRTGFPAGPAA